MYTLCVIQHDVISGLNIIAHLVCRPDTLWTLKTVLSVSGVKTLAQSPVVMQGMDW